MANKERKVSFFRWSQERKKDNGIEQLKSADVEVHFKHVYSRMEKLSQQRRAKRIDMDGTQVVVEVIAYSSKNHDAFLRVGYQNQPNNTALRDQETLATAEIQVGEKQMVELYTCCYIDFTTCIVSYIGLVSAPRIRALKILFDQELENEGITNAFSSILDTSTINDLTNKRVTNLEISIATPGDNILSQDIGVAADDFNTLMHVQKLTCTYKISVERLKSMCESKEDMFRFTENIKKRYDGRIKKFRATIKEVGQDERIIDLLQENVAYYAMIDVDDGYALDNREKNLNTLKKCYQNKKTDLSECIQ